MNITLTSLEAYHETIISGRADTMRERVLEALRCFGPASDKELSRITGIPENTIRPRRGELAKLGMIQVDGVSNEGPGRRKTLWRITK
jgi:predicted ArsR family transcriptional regulator